MKHFTGNLPASLCGAAVSALLFFAAANTAQTVFGEVSNAAASENDPNDVSPEMKAAFNDFTNMKFDDAVAKLERIRQTDKDMAPAQLILAIWLARIQPPQPQAVRQAIESCVTKSPADPEAYVILAELNLQNNCLTEAEVLFAKGAMKNAQFSESPTRKVEIRKRILNGQAKTRMQRNQIFLTTLNNISNSFSSTNDQNNNVSPEMKAAFDDFLHSRLDEAVAKLDKIRETDKCMAPAQLILATWLSRIQPPQPQAVRQAIEAGVTKNPSDPEAYVILAELNLQNNCITEAKALLDKCAILNASFSESAKRKEEIQKRTLIAQAQVHALRGKNDQAIACLNEVLKLDENNIGALNLLGLIHFNSENYDATLDAYARARAIQPTLLVPEARLAMMCQQKNTDESKRLSAKYMKEAVKKYESDPQTHLVAAQWYLQNNLLAAGPHADYAIKLLKDKKAKNPDDTNVNGLFLEANVLRGVIALYEKKFTEAEKFFNVVLAESPNNLAATNNLALALCEQNFSTKLDKALKYAQENFDRFGQQQPETLSTLAWVMHKKGQYQKCAELLQQHIQITNGQISSDTAYYLAANMEKQFYSIQDPEQRANAKKQALDIVTRALANPTPFVMRPEAEALKARLSK